MNILSIDEVKKVIDPKKPTVLVTGVTGQDGSFMVDYLLARYDYNVLGGVRRLSVYNHSNLEVYNKLAIDRFHLVNFDLTDGHAISKLVSLSKPHYFINFAAQSFVKGSWDFPEQTWTTNTTGVLHCLEAIRHHMPTCRFYNAGSSEEFGKVEYTPQDELHPLRPQSPYAASKVGARKLVRVYRESYGLYAVQSWLFNHEGTRRGEEFVTRKITKKVVDIYKAITSHTKDPIHALELGNINAMRDWSDAEDMVDAVWRMLDQEEYNDNMLAGFQHEGKVATIADVSKLVKEYVVASGESHSIREFVELAFEGVGIKGRWEGEGLNEVFRYVSGPVPPETIEGTLVKVNPVFYRPAEVDQLCGNSKKIRMELGWRPQTDFKHLVAKMVVNDMRLAGIDYVKSY